MYIIVLNMENKQVLLCLSLTIDVAGQVVLCCAYGLNCKPVIFNIKLMHAIIENHGVVLL